MKDSREDASAEGRLPPPVGTDATAPDARLAAARALIEREFHRPDLTLVDIAKRAHFSPFHFHRLFRRQYGRTPKQLIEELRIAEVQRLMLGGVSAREAATATGFAHQSHLTVRFKKLVGTTPTRWLTTHAPASRLPRAT